MNTMKYYGLELIEQLCAEFGPSGCCDNVREAIITQLALMGADVELLGKIQRHLCQCRYQHHNSGLENRNIPEHILVVAADKQGAAGTQASEQVADQTEHMGQRQNQQIPLLEYIPNAVAAVLHALHNGLMAQLCALALTGRAAGEQNGADRLTGAIDAGKGVFTAFAAFHQREGGIFHFHDIQLFLQSAAIHQRLHAKFHGAAENGHIIQMGRQKYSASTHRGNCQICLGKFHAVGQVHTHHIAGLYALLGQQRPERGDHLIQLGVCIFLSIYQSHVVAVIGCGITPHPVDAGIICDFCKGLFAGITGKNIFCDHFTLPLFLFCLINWIWFVLYAI